MTTIFNLDSEASTVASATLASPSVEPMFGSVRVDDDPDRRAKTGAMVLFTASCVIAGVAAIGAMFFAAPDPGDIVVPGVTATDLSSAVAPTMPSPIVAAPPVAEAPAAPTPMGPRYEVPKPKPFVQPAPGPVPAEPVPPAPEPSVPAIDDVIVLRPLPPLPAWPPMPPVADPDPDPEPEPEPEPPIIVTPPPDVVPPIIKAPLAPVPPTPPFRGPIDVTDR